MSPIPFPYPHPHPHPYPAPAPPHPFLTPNGFVPFLPHSSYPMPLESRGLSEMIYLFIKSSALNLTFSSACGAVIEGILLGVILIQTTRYLSSFGRSDPLWAVVGMILGAMALSAQLGMNLWQTHRLIDKAATELLEVIIGDIRCNMTVLVLVGILNFVAAGFFGRRAWNLAGNKLWLLCPLAIGIFSSLGLSLGVAIKGLMLPSLAGAIRSDVMAERLIKYDAWRKVDNHLIVIWAATALVQDILICTLMTVMLLKEKDGIHRTERTLLRLLLKLTYETMAGPVVLNIVNVVVVVLQGATFAGYSRIITWILGPVYFSAILQSLNYRKDVQRILCVTPTPRSRSRSSKGNRSTLQTLDSPSIPLTAVDLGTKEVRIPGSMSLIGERQRLPSSTTCDSGVGGKTTASEGESSTGSCKAGKRKRALTTESEARSELTTDIILSGENEKRV